MLLYNDQPVVTVYLLGMLEWMKSLTKIKIIIWGHNSTAFDCAHYIDALFLTDVYITEIQLVIAGSADTLPC